MVSNLIHLSLSSQILNPIPKATPTHVILYPPLPPPQILQTLIHNNNTNNKDSISSYFLPKLDNNERSIIYAACLEGSDPVRLFERRMNFPREPGYEFDRSSLTVYHQMSFAGPPVNTDTVEEAGEFLREDEKVSAIEAEVLSAPPKLVYSKLILCLARKLLVAVVERWNTHVLVIDKVVPSN